MKHILLFLVFYSFTTFSQGLNGEIGFNDDYNQYSRGIVAVDDYSYLVKRTHHSSFFTTCELVKMDTSQNIIWSRTIAPVFAESYDILEMIALENGGVAILGLGVPTCDVAADCFNFIQKFDENGNSIWYRLWPGYYCYGQYLKGLTESVDNHLFVNHYTTSTSKIYELNPSGALTDSITIEHSELAGITPLTDSKIVAFKEDSLFRYDTSGNTINSLAFSSPIKGFQLFNDTLFVLSQNELTLLDANFSVLLATPVVGYTNYSNLKVDSSFIRFISHTSYNESIVTTNHDAQFVSVTNISTAVYDTPFKDFSNNHLSLAIDFSLTAYLAIRHLDYSIGSSINYGVNWTDIGVIDLQPTLVSAVPSQFTQGIYSISLSANALVKNFGIKTLTDCRISHKITEYAICNHNVYTQHFSGLNLAPGDSVWIPLGQIHYETNLFPSVIARSICVYTSHPNYKTDLIVPNDQYCKNIIFGYAGVEEQVLDEIKVYPNPATDILNIEIDQDEDIYFVVTDLQGKKVINGTLQNNQIDISSLAKGSYQLQIISRDESTNHKKLFVKN